MLERDDLVNNRYRILECIKPGGQGEVYRAADTDNEDLEVAVKVYFEGSFVTDRWSREIALKYFHPNLCPVNDYGTTQDGLKFIVMPLFFLPSLSDVIREGSGFSVYGIREIANSIADAMAYLRRLYPGFVHRDLKPSNILIDFDPVFGAVNQVVLCDFGVCRHFAMSSPDSTQLTRTGEVVGTLAYMSPECQKAEPADARSDIYSLGLTLRECFNSGNAINSDRNQGKLQSSDPSEDTVVSAINRMCEENAIDRPQSWSEVSGLFDEPRLQTATGISTSSKIFAIGMLAIVGLLAYMASIIWEAKREQSRIANRLSTAESRLLRSETRQAETYVSIVINDLARNHPTNGKAIPLAGDSVEISVDVAAGVTGSNISGSQYIVPESGDYLTLVTCFRRDQTKDVLVRVFVNGADTLVAWTPNTGAGNDPQQRATGAAQSVLRVNKGDKIDLRATGLDDADDTASIDVQFSMILLRKKESTAE